MNENKFDGKGEIYAQFRPNYPRKFINYLCESVGFNCDSIVADIGSGTGILTRQLLEGVKTVYAVEPNEDMRKIAEKELEKSHGFVSVNATAENTSLSRASVDYVTVAQAFHWFDKLSFKTECKRILRPGGKVILVWNSRDENSHIVKENEQINRKHCPDFNGFSGGMQVAVSDNEFLEFFSDKYIKKVFSNPLKFTEEGFIGRNLSASYALKADHSNYQAYVSELKKSFEKYSENGVLTMPNLTQVYVGKP